ncbi:helix-turn-helix transcriptional regulator [Vibrio sp. S9_S30]|uniref:ArsR/SmtB family transcription factor n=1 Tax=Vibrio sp. S9_S30 TaxID=2720226 RepID=UPI0016818371|nr:metalloregulator ArsR/SmtB family transcription factor [Vibrio sp. S9_S30]MBD1559023.1 helix-turn-helix transcriptional regulator [Vibrio sp. S9_S30]
MSLQEMKTSSIEVADILRVLSHPERLLVLCQLVDGEVGAGQLQSGSTLSQSAFSQHLTVLRKNNLVSVRKESQQVFYSLADKRIERLIYHLHDIFCS